MFNNLGKIIAVSAIATSIYALFIKEEGEQRKLQQIAQAGGTTGTLVWALSSKRFYHFRTPKSNEWYLL